MWVCCEVLECQENTQTKTEFWTAYFEPNAARRGARPFGFAGVSSCQSPDCWPDFEPADITHGTDSNGRPTWKWVKKVYNRDFNCNRHSTPVGFKMEYTCDQLADGGVGCTTPGFDGYC